MLKAKWVVCLTAVLLTGCGTTGHEIKVVDTACTWTRPIYISQSDELTSRTAEQILTHNLTGETRCGWKPRLPSK